MENHKNKEHRERVYWLGHSYNLEEAKKGLVESKKLQADIKALKEKIELIYNKKLISYDNQKLDEREKRIFECGVTLVRGEVYDFSGKYLRGEENGL